MGQDFRAIMAHNLEYEELIKLPERLDRKTPEIREFMVKIRLKDISDRLWGWNWDSDCDLPFEDWLRARDISLSGPESLWLNMGERAMILGCWVRWHEFLSEPEIRECLRSITYHFSRFFNSSAAIYVPDSGWDKIAPAVNSIFDEGLAIEEIIEKLKKDVGPPSPSISKLYRRVIADIGGKTYNCFEGKGYYIDKFEDLH